MEEIIQLVSHLDARYLYLIFVISGASFLMARGLLSIRREERRRLKQAANMDYTDAVVAPDQLAGQKTENVENDGDQLINRRSAVQSIETRFEFMRRFYIPLVLFMTLILVAMPFLPTLPATYLSLLTGVVAGIIGLASRPVIENAIAGMVITFSQPFRINDTVIIDGQYGTVEKNNMLHSVIKIWNCRRLVIPNHKLLQKEIENLTLGDESEWAYIAFHVEPTADINMVKKLAIRSMDSLYREDNEDPSFWVMDLQKDSVLCWVAGWASDPARAWALKSSARRNLIAELQKHNIGFHMAKSNIQMNDGQPSPFQKANQESIRKQST